MARFYISQAQLGQLFLSAQSCGGAHELELWSFSQNFEPVNQFPKTSCLSLRHHTRPLRRMRTSEYEKIDKERIKNERTTEDRGEEKALI